VINFLYLLRSIVNFSITPNSKSWLTVSLQVFLGLPTFFFQFLFPPTTASYSTRTNHCNLYGLIFPSDTFNPHILTTSSLESVSCYVTPAIYLSSLWTTVQCVFNFQLCCISSTQNWSNTTHIFYGILKLLTNLTNLPILAIYDSISLVYILKVNFAPVVNLKSKSIYLDNSRMTK